MKLLEWAKRLPESERESFIRFAGRDRSGRRPAALFREYIRQLPHEPNRPVDLDWQDVLNRPDAYRFDDKYQIESDYFWLRYCSVHGSSPESHKQLEQGRRESLEKIVRRFILLIRRYVTLDLAPASIFMERRGCDAGGADAFYDVILDTINLLDSDTPLWPAWFEHENDTGSQPAWNQQFANRFRPYLHKAIRTVRTRESKRARNIQTMRRMGWSLQSDYSWLDALIDATDEQASANAIAAATSDDAEIIRLKTQTELSDREIGDRLGRSHDAIWRHWQRLKGSLRPRIENPAADASAARIAAKREEKLGTEAMAEVDREVAERLAEIEPSPQLRPAA